ncbi:MAG: WecB/TagA/CpsF family glycosyltransferase [Candidatus Eremiobacteraeota bacterium]|nr:WecB/TagA/CpsF family glycosyltransferase [Candidatus Eremiobacteraeota bacterium]
MYILGCRLDLIDADEACARILAQAREGRGAQVVTLGTEMVVYAQRDDGFRAIVNACALSLCDTVGLLAVARRRGATLRERVTGIDLIQHLCEHAANEGLPIFFLGGAAGVAADAAAILEVQYPGLVVAGAHDGYFDPDRAAEVVAEIRASGARLLLAGLGSPRQEYWLAEHLCETGCSVGIGVGGSFDVISGRIERAPRLLRRFGLEWLYRLMKEPRRWRRQLALAQFLWLVTLETIGFRFRRATT